MVPSASPRLSDFFEPLIGMLSWKIALSAVWGTKSWEAVVVEPPCSCSSLGSSEGMSELTWRKLDRCLLAFGGLTGSSELVRWRLRGFRKEDADEIAAFGKNIVGTTQNKVNIAPENCVISKPLRNRELTKQDRYTK